ncbi:MAG: hypothetical protein M0Z77_00885 [Thermoplasmatales archaeon]|nr:hypothetical protein [Thermoplasmatales archaeon]
MELNEFRNRLEEMFNWYGINCELNYKVNEGSIDLVGYVHNKDKPNLSVLIETSDKLNAHKYSDILNSLGTFKYNYLIVLNDKIKDEENLEGIKVFHNPLNDDAFENEIRTLSDSTKQKFGFSNVRNLKVNIENTTKYKEFLEEIRDQDLSVDEIERILFDTFNLERIYVGERVIERPGEPDKFQGDVEISNEFKFLLGLKLLYSKQIGTFEKGKRVHYVLSGEGMELAATATANLISKNYRSLDGIFKDYGENKVLFSLLGNDYHLGRFVYYDKNHDFYGYFGVGGLIKADQLSEKYALKMGTISKMQLVSSCPLFAEDFVEIFDDIVDSHLGSKTKYYSTRSNYYGTLYSAPFDLLISRERLQEISRRIDGSVLDEFAVYYILRASVVHESDELGTNTIDIGELRNLSIDKKIEESVLEEIRADGIKFKPLKNSPTSVFIYDPKKLKEKSELKLKELMYDLIK